MNDSGSGDVREIQIRDDDKVSLKDIRDTFYRCRDFELTQFWQRSVFLTAFLVLCFTGYGYLMSKYLECCDECSVAKLYPYLAIVSLIGFLFSYIWIWMARGSKAWYEVYESAITRIEREEELEVRDGYRMGQYTDILNDSCSIKNCLGFSGGPFSPSKINILIGVMLILFWGANFLYFLLEYSSSNVWCIVSIVLIVFIVVYFIRDLIKTSSLKSIDRNREIIELIRKELGKSGCR